MYILMFFIVIIGNIVSYFILNIYQRYMNSKKLANYMKERKSI